jgi:UDP-N-acetylmuramate--alanine ligase
MNSYFFCGIGGSGMSAIAQVLRRRGAQVRGSDRGFDRGQNQATADALRAQGIDLLPQDGSAVAGCDCLVVSTAVEESIPDVRAARAAGIPIRRRAEVLAEDIFNGHQGIAIGGTSGKTTVTGMVGHILAASGRRPTVVNGGIMVNVRREPLLGNALPGDPDLPVIEADESDGTIAYYQPHVALITNISEDHKPLAELRPLFREFIGRASYSVTNAECAESQALGPATHCFSIHDACELRTRADGSSFQLRGVPFELPVPGRHNVENALAAVAACECVGLSLTESAAALAEFAGIGRRLELIGQANGITVIDDFAHNPDKIAAALAALKLTGGRLRVMFQPHGFAPTRFLWDGLVQAFAGGLGPEDLLLLPDIYYAGGTASADVSSADLAADIRKAGAKCEHSATRESVAQRILADSAAGDIVVVMGARDPTLAGFARELLHSLGASSEARSVSHFH